MFHIQSVCVPRIMKGAFRLAIRTALEDIYGSMAQWGDDGKRVEVVHALAENVAFSVHVRGGACSVEPFGGKSAPFPGRPVVAVVGTQSGERFARSPSFNKKEEDVPRTAWP